MCTDSYYHYGHLLVALTSGKSIYVYVDGSNGVKLPRDVNYKVIRTDDPKKISGFMKLGMH